MFKVLIYRTPHWSTCSGEILFWWSTILLLVKHLPLFGVIFPLVNCFLALNSFDGIIAFFTAIFSLWPLNLIGHRHFPPLQLASCWEQPLLHCPPEIQPLHIQFWTFNILKIDLIHLCKSHKWQSLRVIHKLNKHNMHVKTIIYLCLYASVKSKT